MKLLPIICVSLVLVASLQAMPAYRLETPGSSAAPSSAGGSGGSTIPFEHPDLPPVIVGPNGLPEAGGYGGAAVAVPEPSSAWLLLGLGLIPLLKLRSNRKSRAS